MRQAWIKGWWAVSAAVVMSCVLAAASPVVELEKTAQRMMQQLNQQKVNLRNNPRIVRSIVVRTLLPQVDQTGMARSALGREMWIRLDNAQRQRFTKEFIELLIRTYSSAIAQYSNQTVEFLPLREDYQGRRMLEVQSRIVQPGGPAIPVNYRVVLIGSQWKVYDIVVEGVSMVQSFKSQFSRYINQGGFDELIRVMSVQNLEHR